MSVLGYAVLGQSDGSAPVGGDTFGSPGRHFHLGDTIHLVWHVTDVDDAPADPTTVAVAVAHEDGSSFNLTPSVTHAQVGRYSAPFTPSMTGRFIATFTATGSDVVTASLILDVQPVDLAHITLVELRSALGQSTATDAEVLTALDEERDDQAEWCRIDPYTPALRNALVKRVVRSLAARRIVTSQVSTVGPQQGMATVVMQLGSEIERLEMSRRLPGFA